MVKDKVPLHLSARIDFARIAAHHCTAHMRPLALAHDELRMWLLAFGNWDFIASYYVILIEQYVIFIEHYIAIEMLLQIYWRSIQVDATIIEFWLMSKCLNAHYF
jgi:hypothetical protein